MSTIESKQTFSLSCHTYYLKINKKKQKKLKKFETNWLLCFIIITKSIQSNLKLYWKTLGLLKGMSCIERDFIHPPEGKQQIYISLCQNISIYLFFLSKSKCVGNECNRFHGFHLTETASHLSLFSPFFSNANCFSIFQGHYSNVTMSIIAPNEFRFVAAKKIKQFAEIFKSHSSIIFNLKWNFHVKHQFIPLFMLPTIQNVINIIFSSFVFLAVALLLKLTHFSDFLFDLEVLCCLASYFYSPAIDIFISNREKKCVSIWSTLRVITTRIHVFSLFFHLLSTAQYLLINMKSKKAEKKRKIKMKSYFSLYMAQWRIPHGAHI